MRIMQIHLNFIMILPTIIIFTFLGAEAKKDLPKVKDIDIVEESKRNSSPDPVQTQLKKQGDREKLNSTGFGLDGDKQNKQKIDAVATKSNQKEADKAVVESLTNKTMEANGTETTTSFATGMDKDKEDGRRNTQKKEAKPEQRAEQIGQPPVAKPMPEEPEDKDNDEEGKAAGQAPKERDEGAGSAEQSGEREQVGKDGKDQQDGEERKEGAKSAEEKKTDLDKDKTAEEKDKVKEMGKKRKKGQPWPVDQQDMGMREFIVSSEKSHALWYLVLLAVVLAALYLVAHNRKKIMGCMLEGRKGSRGTSARYRRLSQHANEPVATAELFEEKA